MRLQLRSLLAAMVIVFVSVSSSQAVDVTFDLTQIAFNNATSSLTSGGYTLLFTSTSGILSGATTPTVGGLAVNPSNSFTIQKTAGPTDLIFTSYTIGNVYNFSANTISFNLSGGTGTSTGNTLTALSTLNYQGSYSIVGSQTVNYTPSNFGNSFPPDTVYFNSLTFTAVPEPSTYALAAIATGVMAAVARRRKARKA